MEINLQRKTDLALRVLGALGSDPQRVSGAVLATETGTSPSYLLHVVQPLTNAGWVESTRGPNGGYRLVTEPGDISVLDVIEAVEGPMATDRCVLRGGPCPGAETCALHDPWFRARTALLTELAATPISVRVKDGVA